MAKIRKFHKLNGNEQLLTLVMCLTKALQEHPDFYDIKKHKTDIYGIACQYGKRYNIKMDDYKDIEYLNIKDIVELFNEGY